MSKNKSAEYKVKPLMYIVQPDNQDIQVNMQSFVVKKAKSKVAVKNDSRGGAQTLVKELDTLVEEVKEVEEAKDIQEEATVETQHQGETVLKEGKQEQTVKEYRKQRKPISKMNVAEKVDFFKNLPKNMPRTLCQIESKDETYRGVIITEEEGIVTIRSLTHAKPIDLPIDAIKAINLLGF
ncbi:CotO family spore coat protein [Metabacillus sp. HB246100]